MKIKFVPQLTFVVALALAMAIVAPAQDQIDKQTKSAQKQIDKQTKSAQKQIDEQTRPAQEQIDEQTRPAQEQVNKQANPAQATTVVRPGQVQVVASRSIRDQIKQSRKASEIFAGIMGAPDNEIPRELLDGAECVAVFPDVYRAGFVIGGRYGRGVASCRTPWGWSAPAYFTLGGGSWGLQIGGQSTDLVMLFMNRKGLDSLMKNKFTIGADAAATAGPVGREVAASTDAYLNSQILVYSRSKGLFAGAIIDGSVVRLDKKDMREVYNTKNARRVLSGQLAYRTPSSVMTFPQTLSRYSRGVKTLQ